MEGMTAAPERNYRSKAKFTRQGRPCSLLRSLSAFVFALISMTAILSHAAGKSPASCWVEFQSSPPAEDWGRLGLKLPSFRNFNRYAVVTNPSVPDYRWGVNAEKHIVVLFRASCENSREAIAALVGKSMARTKAPRITSVIVRSPKPSDLRLTKFYVERPKFWFKDCVVAIGMTRNPQGKWSRPTDFLDVLDDLTINRTDIFAPNSSTVDYVNARIVIAFWHGCDHRREMAQRLLSAYRQRYGHVGRFEVLEKFNPPEYDRATSGSTAWLDYYFPDGPAMHPK